MIERRWFVLRTPFTRNSIRPHSHRPYQTNGQAPRPTLWIWKSSPNSSDRRASSAFEFDKPSVPIAYSTPFQGSENHLMRLWSRWAMACPEGEVKIMSHFQRRFGELN